MKKIYLISAITIIIGIIFSIKPYWFQFLWGWQILLLPLTAGIFIILVQNENRSYKFVPKLVAGSLIIGFIYPFILQIIEYFKNIEYYDKSFFWFINPLNTIDLSFFLTMVCIFGGLLGIVIRGVSLLLNKNNKA